LDGFEEISLITAFTEGYSNLTYKLASNLGPLVLRQPPPGTHRGSAHDVVREHRVLTALAHQSEDSVKLAPTPLLVCTDDTILGTPFYIMEFVSGPVIRIRSDTKASPPPPERMRAASKALISTLAQLHRLPLSPKLMDLGRPVGYVERQVKGWTRRFAEAHTPDVAAGKAVAEYLHTEQPSDFPCGGKGSLVHNDYKFDNVVFVDDSYNAVRAILDWEMATVGDPWMDLGLTLAYWAHPEEVREMPFLGMNATHLPGCLRRSELVKAYASMSTAPPDMLYYYVFGNFKIAGIVQQLYARYVNGQTSDARFSKLGVVVNYLLERAERALANGQIE